MPHAAQTAPSQEVRKIEEYLFAKAQWTAGTQEETHSAKGSIRTYDIVSLAMAGATHAQRETACSVLDDWGLSASIVRSLSLGDIEVLRIQNREGDVDRLKVARMMFKREAWLENMVTNGRGKASPALNMAVPDGAKEIQVAYVLDRLSGWGIQAADVHSRFLGGIRVLRVAGDDVDRLRSRLPTLGRPAPAVPTYPAQTHTHFSSPDGSVLVRTRDADGIGILDNPAGPAAVTATKTVYALQGRTMSREEWAADPRVVAAMAPPAAPGNAPGRG